MYELSFDNCLSINIVRDYQRLILMAVPSSVDNQYYRVDSD